MEVLGMRHKASGAHTFSVSGDTLFADYVAQMRELLQRHHHGKNEEEDLVEGNVPFELQPEGAFAKGKDKPYRRGVLLVHGLTDSPYHMRALGRFFQQQGFSVKAILLPGHGTQPGDLLKARWREWAKAVAYGCEQVAREADELYLAGFSAGAALSVLQAGRDRRVRGLFLFSPAFEITSQAKWANLHKLYSWAWPQAAWVKRLQDRDLYKYESFCKNAAAQTFALTQALPRQALEIPVFVAASAEDATVNSQATLSFMQRARHPLSKLVWYSAQGVPAAAPANIEVIDSQLPQQLILSSAHTAIVIPPEDAHYGAKGSYVNCMHYLPQDKESAAACRKRDAAVWYGEVTETNLQHGLLRRLMYNPHYADMEASMRAFIERLP